MRTPIRTFLFTALVFLSLATGVQAQDKYEFATVTQWSAAELKISIEGKPIETLPLGKELKHYTDYAQLFNHISKMQDEGWEVFNTLCPTPERMIFVLRRKKA